MEHTVETTIIVNGSPVTRRIPARQHVIDFLREELGLTGSHVGCEHGVCGACTVRVDGKDRKSTRLNSSHIQKSRMPSSA